MSMGSNVVNSGVVRIDETGGKYCGGDCRSSSSGPENGGYDPGLVFSWNATLGLEARPTRDVAFLPKLPAMYRLAGGGTVSPATLWRRL